MRLLKKATALILAAAVSLGCFATAFAADSPTSGPDPTKPTKQSSVTATDGSVVNTTKKGEATILEGEDTKTTDVKNVTVDGVKYKVRKIYKKAYVNSSATKVRVLRNVQINKNAFKGSKVKTVVFKGKANMTLKQGALNGVKTVWIRDMSSLSAKRLQKRLRNAGFTGTIKLKNIIY